MTSGKGTQTRWIGYRSLKNKETRLLAIRLGRVLHLVLARDRRLFFSRFRSSSNSLHCVAFRLTYGSRFETRVKSWLRVQRCIDKFPESCFTPVIYQMILTKFKNLKEIDLEWKSACGSYRRTAKVGIFFIGKCSTYQWEYRSVEFKCSFASEVCYDVVFIGKTQAPIIIR